MMEFFQIILIDYIILNATDFRHKPRHCYKFLGCKPRHCYKFLGCKPRHCHKLI